MDIDNDPMKETQDRMMAIQKMLDPMKETRERMMAIQKITDPMKEFRESMKASQELLAGIAKSTSFERWEPVLDGGQDIAVTSDGTVSIGSTIVTQEQVQELAQKVISNALKDRENHYDQLFERLFHEISSLKDPILQKILAWFIYPLIVGIVLAVVSPICDYYITKGLNSGQQRQVVKDLSKAIVDTFTERGYLKQLRIVSTTSLNVRKYGSKKSHIVGDLHLGDIVEVIKKGRKWSFICWQDGESGDSMRGWVFSRYLKVIK